MKQRNAALKAVSEKGFAVTEWNLYLDTHPTDMQAFAEFKKAVNEYKLVKESFVNEHGPLFNTDICRKSWISDPWPWDYEGCGC